MTTTTSRRALLGAASALAGASAINVVAIASTRAAAAADPVYAAIEAHRAAEAEFCRVIRLDDRTPKAGPARVAFQAAYDAAHEAESAAEVGLLEVEPTTMAGVVALINYVVACVVGGHEWSEMCGWPRDAGRDLHVDFAVWLLANVGEDIERLTAGGVAS